MASEFVCMMKKTQDEETETETETIDAVIVEKEIEIEIEIEIEVEIEIEIEVVEDVHIHVIARVENFQGIEEILTTTTIRDILQNLYHLLLENDQNHLHHIKKPSPSPVNGQNKTFFACVILFFLLKSQNL